MPPHRFPKLRPRSRKSIPETEQPLLSNFEAFALSLNGFLFRDQFLGSTKCNKVRSEVAKKLSDNSLKPAGIGREKSVNTDIRGDHFCWLEKEGAGPGLRELMGRFEALRKSINRQFYLGLDRYEMQLAHFAAGSGGYKKHLDAFKGNNQRNRRLTAIYYLNLGWKPGDGGELELYLADQELQLEPVADRLVVFFSEQLEHAVLPNSQNRMALTAWFHAP